MSAPETRAERIEKALLEVLPLAEEQLRYVPATHESREPLERARAALSLPPDAPALYVIFDGPPDHDAGRFVEVETDSGRSVSVGEWSEYADHPGLWRLGPFYAYDGGSEVQSLKARIEVLEAALRIAADIPPTGTYAQLLAALDRVQREASAALGAAS